MEESEARKAWGANKNNTGKNVLWQVIAKWKRERMQKKLSRFDAREWPMLHLQSMEMELEKLRSNTKRKLFCFFF